MIQKLKEATALFTKNIGLFSLIALTVWLPGSLLLVYLRWYVFPQTSGGDEFRLLVQEIRVSIAIEVAFGPLYVGAILHAASQIKQELPATYAQSMTHGARRSFKLLGTHVTTGLLILGGFIALVIPGIILALRFVLVDALVVLDNVEGRRARQLSARLTQGKRLNILGTILLMFVAILVFMFLSDLILYSLLPFFGQTEHWIIDVISECVMNVLLVLPTLVLFLFYWEAKSEALESIGERSG